MFNHNLTQESILARLAPVLGELSDEVIPQKVKLLPTNHYSQAYAWMYSYEKQLKYRIQELLGYKLIYSQEKVLFGPGGAVSEAISNAFVHGHKKDRYIPISIWTAVSKRGVGFAVSDTGKGFDIKEVMDSFTSGQDFFHIAGNGFSHFHDSTDFEASYQQNGRQLCILYLFSISSPASNSGSK